VGQHTAVGEYAFRARYEGNVELSDGHAAGRSVAGIRLARTGRGVRVTPGRGSATDVLTALAQGDVNAVNSTVTAFGAGYKLCVRYLHYEAELLDDRRYEEWLTLLSPEIEYRIPTRLTRERGSALPEFSEKSFLMLEDIGSLRTRVRRLATAFAFAEDPPTRTRRIIGNIRTGEAESPGEFAVKSNFILVRTKMDQSSQLIAGERSDVLRSSAGNTLLVRRVVHLEHTVLPMENLAIFI
jgi:3-phenylpropionate/cinnamic acid dioxygenase small subunit